MFDCAFAGFLKVVCACVVILMQSLDAGHAPKKHGAPCRPKELTALTKSLVEESLTGFVSTQYCIFAEDSLSQPLSSSHWIFCLYSLNIFSFSSRMMSKEKVFCPKRLSITVQTCRQRWKRYLALMLKQK